MSKDDPVVCTINKSEPPYQPNIYLCNKNSYCCYVRGQPVCCISEVTIQHVFNQTYPIVLLFLSFFVVPLLVKFYFSDNEPPEDIETETKLSMMSVLCPSGEDDNVDDPLFGKVFEERVSKRAYVANQTETPEALRHRKSTYKSKTSEIQEQFPNEA